MVRTGVEGDINDVLEDVDTDESKFRKKMKVDKVIIPFTLLLCFYHVS